MESLYSIMKIASMIATGLFGALALLTKYKNEDGRITKWGKIALSGIIMSVAFSLGLYTLETARAKAAAVKAEAEAKAQSKQLETILVNAETTAEQQKMSLDETNLVKQDLTKALEKSDQIAGDLQDSLTLQKEEGEKAAVRNDQMLAQVERTIHPLFPLEMRLVYLAPLSDGVTMPFRQKLQAQLEAAKRKYPDRDADYISLRSQNPESYPSRETDPLGYGLVTADLCAVIRFYTKHKTARRDFENEDASFSYCPVGTSRPLISDEEVDREVEITRERLKNRRLSFDPDSGLRFDDGIDKIELATANAGGDFISSDDLYGATIQIEARPFIKVHRKYSRVANDMILLAGCWIKLPGNRTLWIQGNRFSKTEAKNELLYRFTFPATRRDFNKLLSIE